MYVVRLAKCCIIAVVYVGMYVVHLDKCCIIAVVYVCMYLCGSSG